MQATVEKTTFFVSKPKGEKPRHRWQDSIKFYINPYPANVENMVSS